MSTPLARTRLEKAAADCGFELAPLWDGEVLTMRSALFTESVDVEMFPNDRFQVTPSVLSLMPTERPAMTEGWGELYKLLDTASSRARTLPNRVVQRFRLETASLPKTTESECLVVQRVGQNLFRQALLDYWQCRCCVTGLAVRTLLRASHIRPWALCESDEQRLDVFNGLLLAPNMDAVFDAGLMTVEDSGAIKWSAQLTEADLLALGMESGHCVRGLSSEHLKYLQFHRAHVFR